MFIIQIDWNGKKVNEKLNKNFSLLLWCGRDRFIALHIDHISWHMTNAHSNTRIQVISNVIWIFYHAFAYTNIRLHTHRKACVYIICSVEPPRSLWTYTLPAKVWEHLWHCSFWHFRERYRYLPYKNGITRLGPDWARFYHHRVFIQIVFKRTLWTFYLVPIFHPFCYLGV